MESLAGHPAPRTCGSCHYWTPGWFGPPEWGFCTWRETGGRARQPRMNRDSQYTLTAKGQVLETRCDAGCIQWQAAPARPIRKS